jgi:hypothetical protein
MVAHWRSWESEQLLLRLTEAHFMKADEIKRIAVIGAGLTAIPY